MSFTYRGLKATCDRHIITDSEVNRQLERLRQQNPRIAVVTDRPTENGDEHAATEGQGLVLGGAAGELDTVAEACVIQNHFVTVLGGTVGDNGDAGILLAQTLKLAIYLRIGDDMAVTSGFQTTVSKTHKKSPFIYHSS